MHIAKFIFYFSSIVCILSCVSVAGKNILYVHLTDRSKFVLLPTEGIEQEIDMPQFLSAEFGGQNYFLNTWVKANKNVIEMTFFNELGASMGEISYSNGEVHFSSNIIPSSVIKSFKPEYVIADFQFCFYNSSMLGESLKDSGLVLQTEDGIRRILNENKVLIEIKKTKNSVKLINYLHGYSYTLEGDFHEIQ